MVARVPNTLPREREAYRLAKRHPHLQKPSNGPNHPGGVRKHARIGAKRSVTLTGAKFHPLTRTPSHLKIPSSPVLVNPSGPSKATDSSDDEQICISLERMVLETTLDRHMEGSSQNIAAQEALAEILFEKTRYQPSNQNGGLDDDNSLPVVQSHRDLDQQKRLLAIVNHINGDPCIKRVFELRLAIDMFPDGHSVRKNILAIMRDIKDQKITYFPPDTGYLYQAGSMVYRGRMSPAKYNEIVKHASNGEDADYWWETGPRSVDVVRAYFPMQIDGTSSGPEEQPGLVFETNFDEMLEIAGPSWKAG
ncbi:hypothetical protein TWF718_004000 [Orbilia javanica]|uniref:Uncharacterized protein n=1 Tax=Orbilia javanica TaxID=47235 RepID=A0AAN8RKG0_9PEZI